jgi:hypothetical protein
MGAETMNEDKRQQPEPLEMGKRMLSTKELAHYINLAPQTIKNQFYAGTFPIPATRLCRKLLWDKKVVDRCLDRLSKSGG